MKRRAIEQTPLLCLLMLITTRWYSRTLAFSTPDTPQRHDTSEFKAIVEEPLNLLPALPGHESRTSLSDRRIFLSRMIGMGGLGVAASTAMAAEMANGGGSKSTTYTSITNLPGMGVSKRVGGLANKIRGICLYMVR